MKKPKLDKVKIVKWKSRELFKNMPKEIRIERRKTPRHKRVEEE